MHQPSPSRGADPARWSPHARLLAVRLDNVGDVVMLAPALRALKAAFPSSHLTLMASPAGAQAAPLLPWVDDVLVRRTVWQDASGQMGLDPERERVLVEDLRQGRFDAALIFTSFRQTPYPPAYACYLAGIPVRIGQSREFGGSLLTEWIRPPADEAHQVDRNLNLLASIAIEVDPRMELSVPSDALRYADGLLAEIGIAPGGEFAVLAPWASCPARSYPVDRIAAVARTIADLADSREIEPGHVDEAARYRFIPWC